MTRHGGQCVIDIERPDTPRRARAPAPAVTPCFTPGTLIATPEGERPVEALQPGDEVLTRDNGPQPVRWIGRRHFTGRELAASPHLNPILIRAGALGNGLPVRDMRVSPNHRVLVSSSQTALYFREREVLAAAKHLVNNRGVFRIETTGTTYLHFLCERHEVVCSDGCWTESFQPAEHALRGIGNAQRQEIYEIFPELRTRPEGRPAAPARPVVTARELGARRRD